MQEEPMTELLDRVLEAHGGAGRWHQLTQLRVEASVGGSSWPSDGVLAQTVATLDTTAQRVSYDPFGAPGRRSRFTPERVEILDPDGNVIAGRDDPRRSFDGYTHLTPWDQLQKAYFASYALWNYLNAPFLLTWEGIEVSE